MKTAENGHFVSVHYTGRLENGEIFDSSEGREPLQFQLGSGAIIKGFNDAVIGMSVGEEKEITIPPEEAYGYRDEELVRPVPKAMFGADLVPEVGMVIGVQMENGARVPATITEVTEDSVTLDMNPPLAGKTLKFNIKLMEISEQPPQPAGGCASCGSSCAPSDGGGCCC